MMVPEFGFGTHLDAMHEWHHTRGVLPLDGSGWRDENGHASKITMPAWFVTLI